MKQAFRFRLKQYVKMLLQHAVLPAAYRLGCLLHPEIDPRLVIFADAHHSALPFSMQRMYRAVSDLEFTVVCHLHDYSGEGILKSFYHAAAFMELYSKARYVFICDNFLPVAACKKRKETVVVQLWHSCGLLKKMGYDSSDDVPSFYKGNVYRNYDLVTVSAPCCIPALTSGMRLPDGVVAAAGVSRTDFYFDPAYLSDCRESFYRLYPDAAGKKILLWAPTFRGNAANPYLVGEQEIRTLQKRLGGDWFLLIKAHPHLDKKEPISNCSLPSERVLPVTDLLITDYSSILFDFLFFQKPFVLFAPDLESYEAQRGFYIPYPSLTRHLVIEGEKLTQSVEKAYENWENGADRASIRTCLEYHNGACDGHATERIINLLKMRNDHHE